MFNAIQLTDSLLGHAGAGMWEYAPKPIRDAIAIVDAAYRSHADAETDVYDAEVNFKVAEMAYEQAGREAVMAETDLPDKRLVDAARWKFEVAKNEAKKAELTLEREKGNLTLLLLKADLRDSWRNSVTALSKSINSKFTETAAVIAEAQALKVRAVQLSHFLGDWGSHATLPPVTNANPAGELHALANLKPWEPGEKSNTAQPDGTNPTREGRAPRCLGDQRYRGNTPNLRS